MVMASSNGDDDGDDDDDGKGILSPLQALLNPRSCTLPSVHSYVLLLSNVSRWNSFLSCISASSCWDNCFTLPLDGSFFFGEPNAWVKTLTILSVSSSDHFSLFEVLVSIEEGPAWDVSHVSTCLDF